MNSSSGGGDNESPPEGDEVWDWPFGFPPLGPVAPQLKDGDEMAGAKPAPAVMPVVPAGEGEESQPVSALRRQACDACFADPDAPGAVVGRASELLAGQPAPYAHRGLEEEGIAARLTILVACCGLGWQSIGHERGAGGVVPRGEFHRAQR
jgi:hypothetical protein